MVNAVTYVREESLVTSQNKAEKSFLEKFRKDKPSLEKVTSGLVCKIAFRGQRVMAA